jgi:myo-inositol-hexaphosphate 3-phosphohydrolase
VGTTSSALAATLSNTGNATLNIGNIAIGGTNPTDFAIATGTNACGATLAASATCNIYVTFTPAAAQAYVATITVTDNATPATQSSALTGAGTAATAPVATLTATLPFPSTMVNTTSSSLAATLSNTGNATLNIGNVAIGGANPTEFAITTGTNACGVTLAANATCNIYVTFTPAAAQAYSATLTVTDNASPTTQSASLTGTGTAVAAPVATLTATLPFPATTVGTTSSALASTLSNTGNATLNIGNIAIGGTNPTDFAIATGTNACGATLAANATCNIYVTFTPAAAQAYTATLTVTDNASPATQASTLTGTGAAAAAPIATLSPASLSFTATTGTTTAAQAATLSNTGNAALNISSIALAGTNPTNFAITTGTNSCGETLSSGATCNIYVTFTPASAASFSASLQVTDNAAGSPQSTSLSGIGTAAVVASFTIGSSTSAQTVQPGGTATYTISATAQNGAFTTPVTLAASGLPAGATATFTPASITPGSSSATSALSIQTATTTAAAAKRSLGWPLAAPALAIVSLLFVPGKRRRRWITMALLLFAFLGAIATLTGCGGGFSLTPPAQTYTITVTGTSGAETQSTTVQLTVQ